MNEIKEEIKKIEVFDKYNIINSKYLIIKNNIFINDVYYELCNKKIKEYLYDDDYIDQIYKDISSKMDDAFKYYFDLQDRIEEMLYPSESYYHLILNISKIYHLLDLGRFFLDRWREKCGGIIRKVYLIDNNSNILNLDKEKREYYILHLVDLYKNNYDFSFFDVVNYYDYEKYHFLSYVSIPDMIDGKTIDGVYKLNNYVIKTYELLLEEYKKYQENSHNEFEEENKDI